MYSLRAIKIIYKVHLLRELTQIVFTCYNVVRMKHQINQRETKMIKEDLEKGTRIYYNGDMANDEGHGVVTGQGADDFGTWVNVKMDDGRKFDKLSVVIFSDKYLGHGGTRFVTEEAYNLFRQEAADRVMEELKKGKKGISDDRLDELLVKASKEAEHRGESELMDSLRALKLGLEYGAKLAVEKQLAERKKGFRGEFDCGRARAYKEVAGDLGKIIKEAA